MALLWELYLSPDGLSASELARRLETQRTALYRLLRPFLRSQFIRRGDRKKYYLGLGITALARAVAQPIESVAHRPLQTLADETGCSAMIIADTDGVLLTVISATPRQPGMYVTSPNGFVHQGNDLAMRAILAGRPPSPSDEAEVREDRDRGYATNEHDGFVTTIALPLTASVIGAPACLLVASLTALTPAEIAGRAAEAVREITVASDR